jgi:hypothetical protein
VLYLSRSEFDVVNCLKNKKYLAAINEKMPAGWQIREAIRIADVSRYPTFALYLVRDDGAAVHVWPIVTSMPRRVLRQFVTAAESEGFGALFNPNLSPYSSYTAMIGVAGYESETLGLLEALMEDGLSFVLMNCFSAPKKEEREIVPGAKSEIDSLLE